MYVLMVCSTTFFPLISRHFRLSGIAVTCPLTLDQSR